MGGHAVGQVSLGCVLEVLLTKLADEEEVEVRGKKESRVTLQYFSTELLNG